MLGFYSLALFPCHVFHFSIPALNHCELPPVKTELQPQLADAEALQTFLHQKNCTLHTDASE